MHPNALLATFNSRCAIKGLGISNEETITTTLASTTEGREGPTIEHPHARDMRMSSLRRVISFSVASSPLLNLPYLPQGGQHRW